MAGSRACWSSCDRLLLATCYLIVGVLQLSAGLVLLKAKYVSHLLSGPNFWTAAANLSVSGLVATSVSVWEDIRSAKQSTRRHLLCALVSSVVVINGVTAGILYWSEKHTLVSIRLEDHVLDRTFVVQIIRYAYRGSLWLPLICIALSICFLIRIFYNKRTDSPSDKQFSEAKPEGYNWVFEEQSANNLDQHTKTVQKEARRSLSPNNDSWKDLQIKPGKSFNAPQSSGRPKCGPSDQNDGLSVNSPSQKLEDVQISLQALLQVLVRSNGTLKITDIELLSKLANHQNSTGELREDVFEDFSRDLGTSHKVRRTSTTRDLTRLAADSTSSDQDFNMCDGDNRKNTSQGSLKHAERVLSMPRTISLPSNKLQSSFTPSLISTQPKRELKCVPTPHVPPVDYTTHANGTSKRVSYSQDEFINKSVGTSIPKSNVSFGSSILKGNISSGYMSSFEADSWTERANGTFLSHV